MKKLTLTVLAVGFGAALQPFANAQFGSGIVFDPTQSGHAITQIEHEEQSISNQVQQIENGQQIFSNTVKIASTALQTYNQVKQQYNLYHQMILAPRMLYSRFLSPTTHLRMLQQISKRLERAGPIRRQDRPTSPIWKLRHKPKIQASRPSWRSFNASTRLCFCSCGLCRMPTRSTPILRFNRSLPRNNSRTH